MDREKEIKREILRIHSIISDPVRFRDLWDNNREHLNFLVSEINHLCKQLWVLQVKDEIRVT